MRKPLSGHRDVGVPQAVRTGRFGVRGYFGATCRDRRTRPRTGGLCRPHLQITAGQQVPVVSEELTFIQGDRVYTPTEIVDQSGSRLHRLTGEAGLLEIRYEAHIEGQTSTNRTSDLEAITYLRPSRYCQSDEVFQQARRQFKGLQGHELIAAVTDFVSSSTTYTPGLSHGTDSAVTTLMTGQGVCRDYAHVVIALLRAMDMPARYAACYAPGLRPMDFHAVAEAYSTAPGTSSMPLASRTVARSCGSRRGGMPRTARSSATTAAMSACSACGSTRGSCPKRLPSSRCGHGRRGIRRSILSLPRTTTSPRSSRSRDRRAHSVRRLELSGYES